MVVDIYVADQLKVKYHVVIPNSTLYCNYGINKKQYHNVNGKTDDSSTARMAPISITRRPSAPILTNEFIYNKIDQQGILVLSFRGMGPFFELVKPRRHMQLWGHTTVV